MKALRIIILTLVIACLLVFSVSCSKKIDEISNIKLDEDTLTITWDRVYGAKDYTVSVSGQDYDKTSRNNKYSLEYLDPGVYEIKIKANGDGIEKKDSDWVVMPVASFDAYFGSTNFSHKWLVKIPETILTREKQSFGVCRYRVNI